MAAMTVVLTKFSEQGNTRTNTLPSHTVVKPQLVIEKRKVPEGAQTIAEYSVKVVIATTDSEGLVLAQKISFEAIVRVPLQGLASDVTAARDAFKAIIAGDEFNTAVTTAKWLKDY